jgi:hypothetical protein
MRQQINLYQPVFDEKRTRLSARTAASMLGIVCTALLFWRIYGGRQVTQLVKEVQSVRAQQQRQAELAGAAGAAQASRGNPVSLQAHAKQLATQLRERQRVLELLRSGAAGASGGFADRLEALARRRVDGVWLDHVVLGSAGGVSSLAGHTLDPNLVPRYFQALAAEPALQGTRFDEFRIGEPPNSDTGSAGAAGSPSAGDAAGVTDSKAPPKAPRVTRFRASSAAPPTPQSRSIS